MPDLILAADASTPPAYSTLPGGVSVVLGYVGAPRCTPHIWTHAEANAARKAVGTWWPIWTVHESAVDAAYGTAAAAGMADVLPGYRVAETDPVFLDVEHVTITHSAAGARACIAAWAHGMAAAGWRHAYAYASGNVGGRWQPHWTDRRPDALPAGFVGIQYAGPHEHPGYDLDVFSRALLADPPAHTPDPPDRTVPHRFYVVRSGDTLTGIAARFGTTWQALYEANRAEIGPDPDVIRPGERLAVGVSHGTRSYLVKQGDTLASIAARFHTGWRELYAANRRVIGANPDLIRPGERLLVP